MEIKIYSTIEKIREKNDEEYIKFSKDKNATGSKEFFYIPRCELSTFITEHMKNDNNIYEIIPENKNIKCYFDLEIEDTNREKDEMRLNKFIKILIKEIKTKYNIKITKKDICILESSKIDKMSYHLIIKNKIYFKELEDHKNFSKNLEKIIEKEEDLTYIKECKNNQTEKRSLIDTCVYSKNRNFRLVNQSKKGKNVILKNINNEKIEDCFITNVEIKDKTELTYELEIITPTKIKPKKIKPTKNPIVPIEPINLIKPITRNGKQIDETKIKITGKTLQEEKKLTIEELHKLSLYKQYLYMICPQDNYDIWIAIGIGILNCGGTKQDFIEYSKLNTKKYEENECNCFDNFKTNKNGYTIGTLRFLARKCNTNYFDVELDLLREFLTIDIKNIKIIEEKTEYLSSDAITNKHNNNILEICKILILFTRLGGGKTQQILRLIEYYKYTKILCITPRTTFAEFIHKELNLQLYSDLNGDYTNAKKLAIQLESLYKINSNIEYELIILDECESILKQFSSETIKKTINDNFATLCRVLSKAKKIIFADAFISQRTIDFALSISKNTEIVILKNTYKSEKQYKAIEINENTLEDKIIEKIKEGKNIYYCSSLKEKITSIEKKLKGITKGIYYYSNNDDMINQTLKNVMESWKEQNIICGSPTLMVGISFSDEKTKHFDYCFFTGYPTCGPRDNLQQIKRVRHLKEETIFFSLPKKINSKNEHIIYNDILEYNNYTTKKKELAIKTLKDYMLENSEELVKTHTMEQYKNLILLLEPSKMNETLKNILFYNIKENLLSKMYYNKMLIYYLELSNYEVTPLEKKETTKIQKTLTNYVKEYEEIPIIFKADVELINEKIMKREATKKEKESASKYYYKNLIRIKMNIEMESRIYYEYYLKPTKKKYLENISYESNGNYDKILYDNLYNSIGTIEISDLYSIKLKHIKKINELLEIKNSQDLTTEIDKKNIELKVYPYLKTNINEIKLIFDLKAEINEKNIGSSYYNLLNNIYKMWNGNILKINEKNKHNNCAINYKLSGESFYEYL